MKTNTFLEKLLQGAPVEWKTLGEVTLWDKRFQGVEGQEKVLSFVHVSAAKLKSLAVENGDITLLSTGNFEGFTNREIAEEFINSAEVITIPTGGTANIKYHNGLFVDSGNLLASSTDSDLYDLKYIYYFLKNINHIIQGFFRGSGVKHPSMPDILKIQIPIPPLAVQKEIARILDAFTAITSELTSELTLRQKQYQHYRDKLLTFGDEVEWKTLGEVAIIGTGSHDTKDAIDDGDYIFYARGISPLRLNTYDFDEIAIITAGDGVGVGKVFHWAEGKYALHQRAYRIVPTSKISARYIYHYILADFYSYIQKASVSSSVTSLRKPMFLKFPVPIPPIEEQKRIAGILDKFHTLAHSLSEGLPKEIKLRQKQYEYYRDLLLGFDNLK